MFLELDVRCAHRSEEWKKSPKAIYKASMSSVILLDSFFFEIKIKLEEIMCDFFYLLHMAVSID